VITGVHAIMFSPDAEKVRAFLSEVLGLDSVDQGWGLLAAIWLPHGTEFPIYQPRHASPRTVR
jgi:hypothetical protein